jgi:hypothetical protein
MLSALESMLENDYCSIELWKKAEAEILNLLNDDEAIFYYSFMQGTATKE